MWSLVFVLLALSQPSDEGRVAPVRGPGRIVVDMAEDGVQVVVVTYKDVQEFLFLESQPDGTLRVTGRFTVDRTTGEAVPEEGGVADGSNVSCAPNAVGGACCAFASAGVQRMVCTCCLNNSCTVCLNIILV